MPSVVPTNLVVDVLKSLIDRPGVRKRGSAGVTARATHVL